MTDTVQMYARHDKPADLLDSDIPFPKGPNPVQSKASPANK